MLTRFRRAIPADVTARLSEFCGENLLPLTDTSALRAEECFAERLMRILAGIGPVWRQYPVETQVQLYWVDFYLPLWNIAIEVDEEHHSKHLEADSLRQMRIENALGCEFVRVSVDDNCDDKINEILRKIVSQKLYSELAAAKTRD